jgi:hypothetical protein
MCNDSDYDSQNTYGNHSVAFRSRVRYNTKDELSFYSKKETRTQTKKIERNQSQ